MDKYILVADFKQHNFSQVKFFNVNLNIQNVYLTAYHYEELKKLKVKTDKLVHEKQLYFKIF